MAWAHSSWQTEDKMEAGMYLFGICGPVHLPQSSYSQYEQLSNWSGGSQTVSLEQQHQDDWGTLKCMLQSHSAWRLLPVLVSRSLENGPHKAHTNSKCSQTVHEVTPIHLDGGKSSLFKSISLILITQEKNLLYGKYIFNCWTVLGQTLAHLPL